MSRLLSLVVSIGYLVGIVIWNGFTGDAFAIMLLMALVLLIPLLLIWRSDELGGYTGFAGKGYIGKKSPGWAVAFVGWLLLLFIPVVTIIEGVGAKG